MNQDTEQPESVEELERKLRQRDITGVVILPKKGGFDEAILATDDYTEVGRRKEAKGPHGFIDVDLVIDKALEDMSPLSSGTMKEMPLDTDWLDDSPTPERYKEKKWKDVVPGTKPHKSSQSFDKHTKEKQQLELEIESLTTVIANKIIECFASVNIKILEKDITVTRQGIIHVNMEKIFKLRSLADGKQKEKELIKIVHSADARRLEELYKKLSDLKIVK